MKQYLKYQLEKLTCFLIGHDWYIVDYVLGMENSHEWNIKECERCRKAELD
jgi:hypothetical protein